MNNPTITFSPTGTFATELVGDPSARGSSWAATANILPDEPASRRPPFSHSGNRVAQRRKGARPPVALVREYRPANAGRKTGMFGLLCLLPGLYAVAHIGQGIVMGWLP